MLESKQWSNHRFNVRDHLSCALMQVDDKCSVELLQLSHWPMRLSVDAYGEPHEVPQEFSEEQVLQLQAHHLRKRWQERACRSEVPSFCEQFSELSV